MSRRDTIQKMYDVLLQRREALQMAVEGDTSLLEDLRNNHQGGDVVDFASDSSYGEISSQLAEAEYRELRCIELAIERMNAGAFGVCQSCQKNIPLARLQALPYAAVCINCKRIAEDAGIDTAAVTDWSAILDSIDTLGEMDLGVS